MPFVRGKTQDHAFNELKKRLTEALLLNLPDFSKIFKESDANGIGKGGVLMQNGRPVAYHSEELDGARLTIQLTTKNCMV